MKPTGYWDRAGRPITVERWGELFRDLDYKIVRRTPVEAGAVITAWIGHDGGEGPGVVVSAPCIFGTLLWDGREFFDASEREALERHAHWVRWSNCRRNGGQPPPGLDEESRWVHERVNAGETLAEVAADIGLTPQALGRRLHRYRQRHGLEGRVPSVRDRRGRAR